MDNNTYDIYAPLKGAYQYLINAGQLDEFCSKLADGTITGFSIQGLFQDSNDYVISINYYPINLYSFANFASSAENITLGNASTPVQATPVNSQKASYYMGSFTINRFHNNYLDFAPYTQITLSIPYFEKINIDPVKAYGTTLSLYMALDLISGKSTVYLVDSNGYILNSVSTQLAITVPLGKTNEQEQKRNNILQGIGLVSSLGSLAYGASSGNALALIGGLTLATKTTTTLLQNNTDQLAGYTGMQGSRDGLCVDKNIRLIIERPKIVSQPDVNIMGKPCMRNLLLSYLNTGFVRVQAIHFDPKGEDIYNAEIDEIVALLKNGVIL